MSNNELQRILFIEDEADIQAVAQVALEAVGGFTVKICSSGEEALQAGEAFAPQLILSDVMMPGMDGPATLLALRQLPTLADTPAIFMTAKVQPQEVAQLRTAGAMAVIAKPFDPMTLAQQIKDVWRQHHA
ncbi:MAG: response regulator [Gammaproteobacteria bacterium]|nr:response regulator [Gammaproteobacteria bacterium]